MLTWQKKLSKQCLIIIAKLDRLSRKLRDTLSIMAELEKSNIALVSVTEQFDFSTPVGKILLPCKTNLVNH